MVSRLVRSIRPSSATRNAFRTTFQLTPAEVREVITNCDHLSRLKFSRVLPWAFTEHGAIMAASVLNSPRAIEMSVFVVRAFVRLRDVARTNAEIGNIWRFWSAV